MDVAAAVKALNQRAARERWYHLCDPTLSFSDPCYGELLELWRARAGTRSMPLRSDITPRDLKNVLRNILVMERVSRDPSRYKFRLVGTAIQRTVGDPTGKMIDEVVPPEHLPRWVGCGDLILDGGLPMRFIGRVHLEGKEYLDAENLYVPLAGDKGEPTYVMGLCRYTPRYSQSDESWESQVASIPAAYV